MTNTAKSKTDEFVLRKGHIHHGFDKYGNRHKYVGGEEGNDRVQLSEAQAKAFGDKFESIKEMTERKKAQDEVNSLKAKEAKMREKLAKKGIDLDEFLDSEDDEESIKKPDPSPSVGTAEPTPQNVTPAPVGSTSDPVNDAPKPGSAAAAAKK